MSVNAIETKKYFTWIGEDGICRTVVKPQAEITLEDAIENTEAVDTFYNGRKFPLLIDSRPIKSMTREARKHFSTNDRVSHVNSFGIIVNSSISRVVGNFFIGMNKTPIPAKLFDSEEKAIEWLKTYLIT